MRDFRIPLVFVVVLAAAAGFVLGGQSFHSGLSRETAPASASSTQAGKIVWSHGYDGAAENAEEHWEKHGAEFPQFHTALQYERAALAFVRHPPSDTLVKHRRDGDTLFYEPSTNTFAVEDGAGEPRTYFKPRNGEKYWDHQNDDGR